MQSLGTKHVLSKRTSLYHLFQLVHFCITCKRIEVCFMNECEKTSRWVKNPNYVEQILMALEFVLKNSFPGITSNQGRLSIF